MITPDTALDDPRPVPFSLTPKAYAALDPAASRRGFPPVVCLCGSTRFHDEFRRANLRLTIAGQIVLSIGCDTKSDADLTAAARLGNDPAAVKTRLDELHKRKIDLADYVLVLNVGGYIGDSTRSEIGYARTLGKPVRYLQPPGPVSPYCGCGYDDCSACAGYGWACLACGAAYFGTAPQDGLCPSCQSAGEACGETDCRPR
jgi:hypothetical protein